MARRRYLRGGEQFALALALLASGGCSKDEPRKPCLRPKPAFRVQITANGGPLPADTLLVVQYQGTVTERYALNAPPTDNEDVCCRALLEPIEGDLPAVACGEPFDAAPRPIDAPPVDAPPEAAPPVGIDAGSLDAGARDAAGAPPRDASGDAATGLLDAGGPKDAAVALPEAGGPGRPKALLCQLWTDGEAEIGITASGYDAIDRVLDARTVEARCGLETADVRIELSGPDAGR